MAFTFVIWAFAAIFLLTAVIFYVFFLFHWIPRADGGLTGYCERKVNKAILKIVTKKVNKALAKNQAKQMKADAKAARMFGEKPELHRAATLPDIGLAKEDNLPEMPSLARTDTGGTLPPYASRPSSPGGIELSNLERGRSHARTGTMGSNYSVRAPLISAAADMGYDRSASPAPSLPRVEPGMPPQRPGTAASQRSFSQRPGAGPNMRPAPGPGPGPAHAYANSGASLPPSRLGSVAPMSATPGPQGPRGPERPGYGPPGARPGLSSYGPTATPTVPPVGLGPVQTPDDKYAQNLGQPTVPDLGNFGSAAPGAQQPTIPNISGATGYQQRLAPSNSQRSTETSGSATHASSPSGPSVGGSIRQNENASLMRPPRDATGTPLAHGYNGASRQPNGPPQPQAGRQYEPYNPNARRPSPVSSSDSQSGGSQPQRYQTPAGQPPYQPTRSATGPVPPRGAPMQPPQRSMTGPIQGPGANPSNNYQRPPPSQGMQAQPEFSSTGRWIPPSQRNNPYAYDMEAQPDDRYRW